MIDCNEWRTERRHECANMGEVKRLELWWQLYRTSLPVGELENFRPMDFCWHECTWALVLSLCWLSPIPRVDIPAPCSSWRNNSWWHTAVVPQTYVILMMWFVVMRNVATATWPLQWWFFYQTEPTDQVYGSRFVRVAVWHQTGADLLNYNFRHSVNWGRMNVAGLSVCLFEDSAVKTCGGGGMQPWH